MIASEIPAIFVRVIVGCPRMKYPSINAHIGISTAIMLTYTPGLGVFMSLEYNIIPIPLITPIPIAIIRYFVGIPNFCGDVIIW